MECSSVHPWLPQHPNFTPPNKQLFFLPVLLRYLTPLWLHPFLGLPQSLLNHLVWSLPSVPPSPRDSSLLPMVNSSLMHSRPTRHTSNLLPWKPPACLFLFWSQGHSVSFFVYRKMLHASCISIGAAQPFPSCWAPVHPWDIAGVVSPVRGPHHVRLRKTCPPLGSFALEVTPPFHSMLCVHLASFNKHLPKGPILCSELLRGTGMQNMNECISWLWGTHLPGWRGERSDERIDLKHTRGFTVHQESSAGWVGVHRDMEELERACRQREQCIEGQGMNEKPSCVGNLQIARHQQHVLWGRRRQGSHHDAFQFHPAACSFLWLYQNTRT